MTNGVRIAAYRGDRRGSVDRVVSIGVHSIEGQLQKQTREDTGWGCSGGRQWIERLTFDAIGVDMVG